MLAHLSGTICLKHSTTLILPPLLKPLSRCTCLITISKLFFTALPIPSSDTVCVCVRTRVHACACVCACAHVVSVIVKRPVLPPSVVDGRSRNPLYYYYYYGAAIYIYMHTYSFVGTGCMYCVYLYIYTCIQTRSDYVQDLMPAGACGCVG